MLLVGQYGTTKHIVRSLVIQWKHIRPCVQHFTTTSSRSSGDILTPEAPRPAPPRAHDKSYAILGGGVTGLSAAYFLSRKFPNAKITIYEASKRLGGWVDSEAVEIDEGQVLFEWGPRSLRPDLAGPGKITAQLIHELGLAKEIVATHRDHVAARNRFVYYPDHLVRMPGPYAKTGLLMNFLGNLRTVLTEPIFKGMVRGILAEPTVKTRPKQVEDESVGDFVRRRFGRTIADNMLSALFHGIYAGDIYQLSAKTLLPKLWYLETRDPAGAGIIPELFELIFNNEQIYSRSDAKLLAEGGHLKEDDEQSTSLYHNLAQQSVYTFTKGIGQLTSQLEQELLHLPNIQIVINNPVARIDKSPDSGRIGIHSGGSATYEEYDYVLSTLSPTALGVDAASNPFLGSPDIRDATTVMVVNLYYSNANITDPYSGFGYLIPQSIPAEQNPERALGVIFASETSGARGNVPQTSVDEQTSAVTTTDLPACWANNKQDTAPGTKLTVMMGGHWWADWLPSDIPSPETAIEMAKSVLARHMDIVDEPLVAIARLQKDAIPQYRIGYRKSMAQVHRDLERFRGRVRVAGPAWQGGVGVNDCVRRAWEIVDEIGDEGKDLVDGTWKTGLEHYAKEQEWVTVSRKGGKVLMKEGDD